MFYARRLRRRALRYPAAGELKERVKSPGCPADATWFLERALRRQWHSGPSRISAAFGRCEPPLSVVTRPPGMPPCAARATPPGILAHPVRQQRCGSVRIAWQAESEAVHSFQNEKAGPGKVRKAGLLAFAAGYNSAHAAWGACTTYVRSRRPLLPGAPFVMLAPSSFFLGGGKEKHSGGNQKRIRPTLVSLSA